MAPKEREVEAWMHNYESGTYEQTEPWNAIRDLKEALEWSEFCRDSLRMERDGLAHVRSLDVQNLLDRIELLESRLEEREDFIDDLRERLSD